MCTGTKTCIGVYRGRFCVSVPTEGDSVCPGLIWSDLVWLAGIIDKSCCNQLSIQRRTKDNGNIYLYNVFGSVVMMMPSYYRQQLLLSARV